MMRLTKSTRLRWIGHAVSMAEDKSSFKILTGKPTRTGPVGKPRLR